MSEPEKRICLDLTPFEMFDRHGGVARYGARLLRSLLALPEVAAAPVELVAMTHSNRPPIPARAALEWIRDPGPEIPPRVHKRRRRWQMGALLRFARVDLFHAIDPNAPPLWRPRASIVTCHDLVRLALPEPGQTARRVERRREKERRLFAHVDHVIADSHVTRTDFREQLSLDAVPVSVVHLGVELEDFAAPAWKPLEASRLRIPGPYVISVGSDYWRKNQARLAEAWCRVAHEIPESLVLVGRALYAQSALREIEARVRERGLGERFAWLGDVEDEALPTLYGKATATFAPSLYEGFGLPLLEAMASGSPVFACDNPAYQEVAAGAAEFFDGMSVESIAEALLRASRDAPLRRALVERGRVRCAELSWRRTAERTWAIYQRLLWPN